MKITIITPTPPDISAFGARALSSFIRTNGYDTRVIFLPGSIGLLKEGGEFVYHYDPSIIKQLIDLSKDSDLIGVSFMSNYYDRALQITRALKKDLDIPVIWGGIHPSTTPEPSLEHTDIVCLGEGEDALLELMQKMEKGVDYYDIEGLWFKKDGRIIKNKFRKIIKDLDRLPFCDFSLEGHYILDQKERTIVPISRERFKSVLPRLVHPDNKLKVAFRTMTDRGCPHKCSYCNISAQKAMFEEADTKYFRHRSAEHSIAELVEIKKKFPFIEAVQFFDDTFFARSPRDLEKFAALYKEKVGLPFYCQASPSTISDRKMQCLVDAGLVYVEMGVQTGSPRIRKLYNRNETNEKIIEATKIISRYMPKIMPPDYHVILDNPWETQDDVMDTVRLLMDIPKPYGLCISSLVFFPQTPLYLKAKKEGLIKADVSDVYRQPFYIPPKRNYVSFLIYLLTFQHFPRSILRFLVKGRLVKSLSGRNLAGVYRLGYLLGETVRFVSKGVKVLYHRDWERLRLYFNKIKVNDPLVEGRKK